MLNDADLQIHNRFFPQSWQIALVCRPFSFQPMQAGFFFRERDGTIHSQSSYLEFLILPQTGAANVAQPDGPAVIESIRTEILRSPQPEVVNPPDPVEEVARFWCGRPRAKPSGSAACSCRE
jgi:hypothetical protein